MRVYSNISLSIAFTPAAGTALAHPNATEVPPHVAFQWMQIGNQRFVRGQPENGRRSKRARAELAQGQKPHTIVVTCSDSRLPPELIFDTGLGRP